MSTINELVLRPMKEGKGWWAFNFNCPGCHEKQVLSNKAMEDYKRKKQQFFRCLKCHKLLEVAPYWTAFEQALAKQNANVTAAPAVPSEGAKLADGVSKTLVTTQLVNAIQEGREDNKVKELEDRYTVALKALEKQCRVQEELSQKAAAKVLAYTAKLEAHEEQCKAQEERSKTATAEVLKLWKLSVNDILEKVNELKKEYATEVDSARKGLKDVKDMLSTFDDAKAKVDNWVKEIKRNLDELATEAKEALAGLKERLQAADAIYAAQPANRSDGRQADSGPKLPEVRLSRKTMANVSQVMLKTAFSGGLIQELLHQYHANMSDHKAGPSRRMLIDRLPELFDFVEVKLNFLRGKKELNQLSPDDSVVLDTLERLQKLVESWQEANGIRRFPVPLEPFDPAIHDTVDTKITAEDAKSNRIQEVKRTGYCFKDNDDLLRRARVVKYVKPRDMDQ